MIALVRYSFATLLHSQRYLAPLLVFLAVVGIMSHNSSGAVLPVYAVSAAALLFCSAWLTMAILNLENPVQRAITVASVQRSSRVLIASVCVAVLSGMVFMLLGLVLPFVLGDPSVRPTAVMLGIEAYLTCIFVGVAVGLPCSRPMIRRQGYGLLVAVTALMILLLVQGLPPINTLFHLMTGASAATPPLGTAALLLACAIVTLVASSLATQAALVRKD